jgi:hypothetical protein
VTGAGQRSTASSSSRTSGASAGAKGVGGTTYSTTTRLMRGSDLAHEPHEELSHRSEDSPRSFVDPALPKP